MTRRNIPFGYEMVGGEIVINELEAAAVRTVFASYLSGKCLREIAEAMSLPYNAGVRWDKHKVKRILDNAKYVGEGGYSPLVAEGDFITAGKLKASKNVSNPLPCSQEIQLLKSAAFCNNCGGRFVREVNRHGSSRWQCASADCGNTSLLRDSGLQSAVTSLLNDIISNPAALTAGQPQRQDSLAVIRLQNEANREMSKAKPDTEHAQSLLLSLAAEKYAACADTHATLALRATFEQHTLTEQFDYALFAATVDKVLVGAGGSVALRLKTGQTLPAP